MGVVYEVEHLHTGQHLALKVLTAQPGASVERFKREARAASRIQSEHIVRVTDADVAPELGGAPFLVMELLEGADLEHVTGTTPASPEDVVTWLRQVAKALVKAHAAGIVHRDLKPENLFLTKREDATPLVKVLDFGIAKMSLEGMALTQSDQFLGTPTFMAPEQADSAGRAVTARADNYALGLIAFKWLTGKSYWKQGSLAQLLAQLLAEPMPPPSARGSSFGPAFDAWFAKACARDPDQRFGSADEQIEALAEALGLPRASLSPTPSAQPRAQVKIEVGAENASVSAPTFDASSADVAVDKGRARRRRGLVLGVALSLAGVAALSVELAKRTPAPSPAASTAGAADPRASSSSGQVLAARGVAVTAHPPPATTRPAAGAAYAAGLQHLRDGSVELAEADFIKAASLDPTMGAAQLRCVVYKPWVVRDVVTRTHLSEAMRLRASLDERDAELLSLFQADWNGKGERMDELNRHFPDDAEVAYLAARRLAWSDPARALAFAHRARELDPHFAAPFDLEIRLLTHDFAAARSAVEECLRVSPTAASCLRASTDIHLDLGECAAAESDAHRYIDIAPEDPSAYAQLARALALPAPNADAVRDALARRASLEPDEHTRAIATVSASLWLAMLTGDFVAAEAAAKEWDPLNETSFDATDHIESYLALFDIYEETGQPEKALALADAYERRAKAWVHNDGAVSARIAYLRRRSGKLDDDALSRAREEAAPLLGGYGIPREWQKATTYLFAESPEEMRGALDAMPGPGSENEFLVGANRWGVGTFYQRFLEGAARLLNGQPNAAVPLLRAAATGCYALGAEDSLPSHTGYFLRASLFWGQALEATRDKKGACAAYAIVLDHWGHAKPRSATAEKARQRMKALGCESAPTTSSKPKAPDPLEGQY
jgi:eukaryotic-like serine/threonine-protein kinase